MNMNRKSMNRRAMLFFIFFSFAFFILTYRFFVLQFTQTAEGRALAAYAEEKYSKSRTIMATRGSILDRNGDPLAVDTASYRLIAILSPTVTPEGAKTPSHVTDPEKTAEILADYIEMEEEKIYELLTTDAFQVEFGMAGRNLTYEEKTEIEQLGLPGITFLKEMKRSYPNGMFASHLLGFANYEKDEETGEEKLFGQMGLEKTLDSYLEGHNGKIHYQSDIWGYILPTSNSNIEPPKNGNDVYLTIDKKIQTFLEDAMTEVDKAYRPKQMMGIVAHAKTGEILAMAQRPSFNPNTREGIEKNWKNIIVEEAFEPGSPMKIFTLAAAVEEGVFNPDELYKSGSYKVHGDTIWDHNDAGWGEITFLKGIQLSSNVAIAKLLEKIGEDTFFNYLQAFKFGVPTDIGLSNEASGKLVYQWPIEKVTTAFGQATSVTALQLIQAMTAITNNGKMMKPYVIDKIVDEDGNVVKEYKPESVSQPISGETAKYVLDVLASTVTSEWGTGRHFAIEGYEVAGKTGTAEIFDPEQGTYLSGWDNYIFSFLGTAPKDDPELIVYVMIQQPDLDEENYEYGSTPVSKIFTSVMKSSLEYLNIETDNTVEPASIIKLDDFAGKPVTAGKQFLESSGLVPVVIGSGGKIQSTFPEAGSTLLEGERVLLLTNQDWTMPNIQGWSLSDVMKLVMSTKLDVSIAGDGFVTSQSISEGTKIKAGMKLELHLTPPEEIFGKKGKQNEENSTFEQATSEEDSSDGT